MNIFVLNDGEPGPGRQAAVPNITVEMKVDRLMSLAFFPGRAPRSDVYREGCRAALEYRFLGRKIPLTYSEGTCEADAWSAGVAEGHSIAKADAVLTVEATTSAEQQLLKAWRAIDDQ